MFRKFKALWQCLNHWTIKINNTVFNIRFTHTQKIYYITKDASQPESSHYWRFPTKSMILVFLAPAQTRIHKIINDPPLRRDKGEGGAAEREGDDSINGLLQPRKKKKLNFFSSPFFFYRFLISSLNRVGVPVKKGFPGYIRTSNDRPSIEFIISFSFKVNELFIHFEICKSSM